MSGVSDKTPMPLSVFPRIGKMAASPGGAGAAVDAYYTMQSGDVGNNGRIIPSPDRRSRQAVPKRERLAALNRVRAVSGRW